MYRKRLYLQQCCIFVELVLEFATMLTTVAPSSAETFFETERFALLIRQRLCSPRQGVGVVPAESGMAMTIMASLDERGLAEPTKSRHTVLRRMR